MQFVDVDHASLSDGGGHSASYVDRLPWVKPDLLLASLGGARDGAALDRRRTRFCRCTTSTARPSTRNRPGRSSCPSWPRQPDRSRARRLRRKRAPRGDAHRVPAGWGGDGGTDDSGYRARQSVPALAVDPRGHPRASDPGGRPGRRGRSRHDGGSLPRPGRAGLLLGTAADWLEPTARRRQWTAPTGTRLAPNGLVALSGAQYTMDGDRFDVTPAGLSLIDPSNWSVRRLSDEPGWVTFGEAARSGLRLERGVDRAEADGLRHRRRAPLHPRSRGERPLADEREPSLCNDQRRYGRFEIIDLESGKTVGRANRRDGPGS